MDGSMDHFSRVLPEQLPVGASYVVEGYGGESGNLRVISRYVLMPDGSRINVPADFGLPAPRRRSSRRRNRLQRKAKSRPLATRKKNFNGARNPPTVATLTIQRRAKPPSPSPSITRR
jgi:hypothetical protein